MSITKLKSEDIVELTATVRGALGRVWGHPQLSGRQGADAALVRVWDTAVEQGWTSTEPDCLEKVLNACAELGRAACPLPLPDVLAARAVLADARPDLTARIGAGSLRPVTAQRTAPGVFDFLEGASVATHVLELPTTGDAVRLWQIRDITPMPGLVEPFWSRATGTRPEEIVVGRTVIDDARTLLRMALTTRAVGAARRAHTLALEYAGENMRFGRAIGSFEMVQRRAAEGITDLTVARILVREALVLRERGDGAWRLAAKLATVHARKSIPRVQLGAHRTLSALGCLDEHEAPWLFRRIRADLSRVDAHPPSDGDPSDILLDEGAGLPAVDLGGRAEAIRTEVRTFLAEHADDPEPAKAFAESGLLTASWPVAHGGRGATVEEICAIGEELGYHGPHLGAVRRAADVVGRSIIRYGTEAQRTRFLPLIAAGGLTCHIGHCEAEADSSALHATAVRDGDQWAINGVSLWGGDARDADWIWLAARTDPDAVRSDSGITVFLVPTSTPGSAFFEHRTLSGEISCTAFFDDIRVGADAVIGEVDGGWQVITDARADERASMLGRIAEAERNLDDFLDVLHRSPDLAGPRGSAVRAELTDLAVRTQAARALAVESFRAVFGGGPEASMAKIVAGELSADLAETILRVLGPRACLSRASAGLTPVPGAGSFEHRLRLSATAVIDTADDDQRALIARALGMPR